jgi:hypothetical protein
LVCSFVCRALPGPQWCCALSGPAPAHVSSLID